MQVVSVNLRPDRTQIVVGSFKKNNLTVEKLMTFQPVFPFLQDEDILQEFFQSTVKIIGNRTANWCITVPDVITTINCDEHDPVEMTNWKNVLSPWVHQMLNLDQEQYFASVPFVLSRKNKIHITGAAIKKNIVTTLCQVAERSGILVESIEFASLGLLRYLNNWEKEYCILEIWENSSSIVGFSFIKGMFKQPCFSTASDILADPHKFSQMISSHDYTANDTFGRANTNIPVYIHTSNPAILTIVNQSDLRERLGDMYPAEAIRAKKYTTEELQEYCVPIGNCFSPLYERVI